MTDNQLRIECENAIRTIEQTGGGILPSEQRRRLAALALDVLKRFLAPRSTSDTPFQNR